MRRLAQSILKRDSQWDTTAAYMAILRRTKAQAVLAQYGPMGVAALPACKKLNVPLIVQFHGADASKHDILATYRDSYRELFAKADAVVAVSSAMRERLIRLGADKHKTILNIYGVDTEAIRPQENLPSSPTLLSVGRFVEKKAPYLTLMAFARAHRQVPEGRLRMIGDGVLLGPCIDLAKALGIEPSVDFLGSQPNDVVTKELAQARAFVQHSIEASDGDCEGTPLAILEAGAAGLPVIATRHAGIPEVVVDGQTGFLVAEKDIDAMSRHMVNLLSDRDQAAKIGKAARERIEAEFDVRVSVSNLWSIIERCMHSHVNRRP
tara:strand:+ start:101940 stop:102905 length:966 start_codon:yes stop_codon:yes gene_type:complete